MAVVRRSVVASGGGIRSGEPVCSGFIGVSTNLRKRKRLILKTQMITRRDALLRRAALASAGMIPAAPPPSIAASLKPPVLWIDCRSLSRGCPLQSAPAAHFHWCSSLVPDGPVAAAWTGSAGWWKSPAGRAWIAISAIRSMDR